MSSQTVAPERERTSTFPRFAYEFVAPLERAWHFRELIRAVVNRELAVRFRGSVLGWIWSILGPLVILSTYTIVFSSAIGVPRSAAAGGVKTYALSIFCGMLVFNLFSELAYRAPGMLHEHVHFIKKSIFPSETLAWIAAIRALTYAGISLVLLLIFELFITQHLPLALVLLPILVVPFMLFLLGVCWFLMAIGSFTRDVSHLMISIVPMLLFATPVFYSISDVPERFRLVYRINIVGNYVDMVRDLLINDKFPNVLLYAGTVIASLIIFRFGYIFFMRYKSIFVDVI